MDFRIGVLTCASDVGPEYELRAAAPADVGVHVARLPGTTSVFGDDGHAAPTTADVADRAAAAALGSSACQLSAAPVAAIGMCSTGLSYRLGRARERRLLAAVGEHARGLPVVAPASAIVRALTSFGARRIALVSPPWFGDELTELGRRYYVDAGFTVGFNTIADVACNQHLVTQADLFRWAVANVPRNVEAVVIAGSGFRSIGVIGDLEAERGIPVLAANQVLLWALMSLTGADPQRVHGYGGIFNLPYAAAG